MEDQIIVAGEENKKSEDNNLLVKQNVYLLLFCIGLGILCDYLFFGKTFGISYPIFTVLFYTVFLYNSRERLSLSFSFGWFLSIPIFLLSLTYFIFSNEIFQVLNFLGIPVLVIAQTTLIMKDRNYRWDSEKFITDILHSMFVRTFSYIGKPFAMVGSLLRRKSGTGKYDVVLKILIGLAISIPLFLVIIPLLSSADQVFGDFVNKIPSLFINVNLEEFMIRTFLIFAVSVIAFSYIWSFLYPKMNTRPIESGSKKEMNHFMDPVITTTILVSINFIYVAFTLIQFTYLFGGAVPESSSYSEYARRGFFELIAVTLINLAILLINIFTTKNNGSLICRIIRLLDSLLVLCTLVMLLSAFYRMWMYEEAYGYTYLRLLTHAFMVFIFVILLITVYRVWRTDVALVKAYTVTALLAYLIINYINIDIIIAKNNIERYSKSGSIDESYLTQLSYDAVPLLVPLLKDEKISTGIQNSLYFDKQALQDENHWQSFNISRYKAKKLLDKYDLKYTDVLPAKSEIRN